MDNENQVFNVPVSVLLAGAGGYGSYYLKTLFEEFPTGSVRVCGVVDPAVERSECYPEIKDRGIPVFASVEAYYEAGHGTDLAVVSSPIHFHAPQTMHCLKQGSRVLCEKPLATVIQDADVVIQTEKETGNRVMVGYQWSYSQAIRALKRDILEGLFGTPIRLKTICCWPRDDDYYARNDWAGRIRDAEGRWVLDSPASNAMAHFLHNLLYILGGEMQTSARPVEVSAELYRANDIENYDTAACRITTLAGAELLFYASHATAADKGPAFEFQFEDATVSFGEIENEIVAVDSRGNSKRYGSPDDDHQFLKLFEAVETVRNPQPILCGSEAARAQVLCVNGMQESMSDITAFPARMIQRAADEGRCCVDGLDEALWECYTKAILPDEGGYEWAKRGKKVDLKDYTYFPGGSRP